MQQPTEKPLKDYILLSVMRHSICSVIQRDHKLDFLTSGQLRSSKVSLKDNASRRQAGMIVEACALTVQGTAIVLAATLE